MSRTVVGGKRRSSGHRGLDACRRTRLLRSSVAGKCAIFCCRVPAAGRCGGAAAISWAPSANLTRAASFSSGSRLTGRPGAPRRRTGFCPYPGARHADHAVAGGPRQETRSSGQTWPINARRMTGAYLAEKAARRVREPKLARSLGSWHRSSSTKPESFGLSESLGREIGGRGACPGKLARHRAGGRELGVASRGGAKHDRKTAPTGRAHRRLGAAQAAGKEARAAALRGDPTPCPVRGPGPWAGRRDPDLREDPVPQGGESRPRRPGGSVRPGAGQAQGSATRGATRWETTSRSAFMRPARRG